MSSLSDEQDARSETLQQERHISMSTIDQTPRGVGVVLYPDAQLTMHAQAMGIGGTAKLAVSS